MGNYLNKIPSSNYQNAIICDFGVDLYIKSVYMESVATVIENTLKYCESLTEYVRRKSLEVPVGYVPLGGGHRIRNQSMRTVGTMAPEGEVAQATSMMEHRCEWVRLTAPRLREAT